MQQVQQAAALVQNVAHNPPQAPNESSLRLSLPEVQFAIASATIENSVLVSGSGHVTLLENGKPKAWARAYELQAVAGAREGLLAGNSSHCARNLGCDF